MAALFTIIQNTDSSIFKGGLSINNAVHVPFLESMINNLDMLIVTEVTIQNRDTVQYFLTFNDLITYFYFGKGLGTMTINGSIFSQCGDWGTTNFLGVDTLMESIGNNFRGKKVKILFGNTGFWAVLSAFTFRASAEEHSLNTVDFNLQFEIIDHGLGSPTFTSNC